MGLDSRQCGEGSCTVRIMCGLRRQCSRAFALGLMVVSQNIDVLVDGSFPPSQSEALLVVLCAKEVLTFGQAERTMYFPCHPTIPKSDRKCGSLAYEIGKW
jgi:hypothetical protein